MPERAMKVFHKMNAYTLIGILAGILTTIAFLPQVIKTWRTRSTGDLSLSMFIALFCGVTLWFIYGFLTQDYPVMIANALTLLLSATLLYFKLKAPDRRRKRII